MGQSFDPLSLSQEQRKDYRYEGPEIIYTSQVGDSHICIPLCVGIYALYHKLDVPAFFQTGMLLLVAATVVHFLFVALFGRLPRFMGWVMVAAYGVFLYKGFGQ